MNTTNSLLAPDRVALLLALIPYLRENGPTPVVEVARDFQVTPDLLRQLVVFLGTAGVPGETLSYQHEDLFDIDWDALERDDLVSLTQVVAIDEIPRFAPVESAALVAGLQGLLPVLPEDQAEIARSTALKLGTALGTPPGTAISITDDPEDPQISVLIAALADDEAVTFEYRPAHGAPGSRVVDPWALSQSGHVWYLRGFCRDRESERLFRVDRMRRARASGPRERLPEQPAAGSHHDSHLEIIAVIPVTHLEMISGFSPEIVEELADERVRVRIDAWHDETAVRLVQMSRKTAVIEAPAAARAAVREWAHMALAHYEDSNAAIQLTDGG